jgi:uncharacterized protein (TIGR03437 family)
MEKGSFGLGLGNLRNANVFILGLGFAAMLAAAPRLAVTQSAYGPISIATGSNGSPVQFYAGNIGDGTLNLSVSSSDSWLVPNLGAARHCSRLGGTCYPVQLDFQTAGLAKGMYTGTVTISDPKAVDSPQTVTVTIAVGGGVPDSVTLYVPNNGTPVSEQFTTSSAIRLSTTQPAGGPTLTVAASSEGSFASTLTFNITGKATSGVAPGSFDGSFTVSRSSVAAENKTVGVTLNVTSQPVAQATTLPVFRVGAAPVTQFVVLSNAGSGTHTISAASGASSDGAGWLSAAFGGPYVAVTVDPSKGSFTPGKTYTGTVTITTNAANSPLTVPVTVEAVQPGPPVVYPDHVLNIVNYTSSPLGLGDLPAIFGEQLSSAPPNTATLPLQTTLGGITVSINNHPVPIYYTSATQINFQVPYEIPPGEAVLTINNGGQQSNSVFVEIAASAPKLFKATSPDSSIVYADTNGPGTPVKRGTPIVIYSLGLGQTSPAATSGVAAPLDTLMHVTPTPKVVWGTGVADSGGTTSKPDFVGLTPTTVGLYQVNVTIPRNAPTGSRVAVKLSGGPGGDSTTMYLDIQ